MAAKVAEPKFFYELIRILDNAYTGDRVSIALEAEKIAEKFQKRGLEERAAKLLTRAKKLAGRSMIGEHDLQQYSQKLGFELFVPSESEEKAKGFMPTSENKVVIDEIIKIGKKREMFWEAEIPIPNKTLMFGPPGTGKTISAHYIANLLELPLILVRLDSLINASLGGTAQNLRKIFDAANKQPCVLFLDEFDAIATNRKNLGDSGGADNEMRRVVNSLLQNLDSLNDECMLFAATNLDNEIDPAVWRRFHNRVDFRLPNEEELIIYLTRHLKDNLLVYEVIELFLGRSFSDVEMIINKAKTKCILRSEEISKEVIQEAAKENLVQRLRR